MLQVAAKYCALPSAYLEAQATDYLLSNCRLAVLINRIQLGQLNLRSPGLLDKSSYEVDSKKLENHSTNTNMHINHDNDTIVTIMSTLC